MKLFQSKFIKPNNIDCTLNLFCVSIWMGKPGQFSFYGFTVILFGYGYILEFDFGRQQHTGETK